MNGACENVHAKCSLHNLPAKVVVTITAISLYNSYNVWSCWMLCAHSIIDIHVCVRVFHCVLLTLILPSLSSRSYSFTLYSHVRKICVRVVSPRSKCRREMSYYFLSLFLSLSLSLSPVSYQIFRFYQVSEFQLWTLTTPRSSRRFSVERFLSAFV